MSDIIKHSTAGPVGVAMSNPADALRACELLLESGVLPSGIKSPAAAFAILQTGAELGLGPMQSLRGIHVVSGRPILSADTMVALCVRSPACVYFRLVSGDGERAEYETLRQGHPEPARMAYTMAEAQAAGLTRNPTWKAHPRAMLRARAKAALARDVYPDLVAGVYTPDEGEEMSRPRAVDAEVVDGRPTQPAHRPASAPPHAAPEQPGPAAAELAMRVSQALGGIGFDLSTAAGADMAGWWLTSLRPPRKLPQPGDAAGLADLAAFLATERAPDLARRWKLEQTAPGARYALAALLLAEGFPEPGALAAAVRKAGIGAPMDPADDVTASRWWAWWDRDGRDKWAQHREALADG